MLVLPTAVAPDTPLALAVPILGRLIVPAAPLVLFIVNEAIVPLLAVPISPCKSIAPAPEDRVND